MIERESEICTKAAGLNPGHREAFDIGQRQGAEVQDRIDDHAKGNQCREQRDSRDQDARKLAAKKSVHHESCEGQQGNQPKMLGVVHSFIRSTLSTWRVFRVRKMAMMIASPTAASAAATTITKKTKI